MLTITPRMDWLLQWDYQLFRWINQDLTNAFFDYVLPLVRNRYIWLPFYLGIFALVFIKHDLFKASYYALIIVSAVCITDIASSRIIKNVVKRPRPCQDINIAHDSIQRVACRRSYSFTSSHATNHFGMAMILSFLLFRDDRRWQIGLFVWASIISFAQIYVGVHFPLDILGGALLAISLMRIYIALIQPTVKRLEG